MIDLSSAEGNVAYQVTSEYLGVRSYAQIPDRRNYDALRNILAEKHSVRPDQITLGNGSDELIENIARIFGGSSALVLTPTFSRLISVNNKQFVSDANVICLQLSPADHFELTERHKKEFIDLISLHKPGIVWLCSPVNPTGTILDLQFIDSVCKQAGSGIVVVDECFIEFLRDYEKYSSIGLLSSNQNLIVINSYSKTKGLPGVRLGYAVASLEHSSKLNKIALYFNINNLAIELAQYIENNKNILREKYNIIRQNRLALINSAKRLDNIELISNSEINIITVRLRRGNDLHDRLFNCGIVTKKLNNSHGFVDDGYVRILIPDSSNNLSQLIKSLATVDKSIVADKL